MFNTVKVHSLVDNNDILASYEDMLTLLDGSIPSNQFSNAKWFFQYEAASGIKQAEVDFSIFEFNHVSFTESTLITIDKSTVSVAPVELAKIIFLEMAVGSKISVFTRLHPVLIRVFAFLTVNSTNKIRANDYEDLYSFLITQKVTLNGVFRRYGILGFSSSINPLNFTALYNALSLIGISDFIEPISENKRIKAASNAVLNIAGITLADYKAGGSFNFLTLDVGKYYFEYLSDVFEEKYTLARAFESTQKDFPNIANDIGISSFNGATKKTFNEILMGYTIDEIDLNNGEYVKRKDGSLRKKRRISVDNLHLVKTTITERFNCYYKEQLAETILYKNDSLEKIAQALEINVDRDALEFIKALVLSNENEINLDSESILNDYISSHLELPNKQKHLTIESFQKICIRVKKDMLKKLGNLSLSRNLLSSTKAHCELGNKKGSDLTILQEQVKAAGAALFVAVTGWRESEFGFPLNAIRVFRNEDAQDGHYNPLRFHVKWIVPKTNGKTELDREIGLSAYLVAFKLHRWISTEGMPCLYESSSVKAKPHHSTGVITRKVQHMWPYFVEQYQGFKDLDELDSLSNIEVLSQSEQSRFIELSEHYKSSSQTRNLRNTKIKVQSDLIKLNAVGMFSSQANSGSRMILDYLQGNLSKDRMAIIDKHLPEKLKDHIISLNVKSTQEINSEIAESFTNAIIAECLYPTPHAFRHCWAEAVYRRFSGDVGWFIRSNFKHFDSSFFMRYLRNKNMKTVAEISKRTVINSILRNHIEAQQDNERDYAGRLDSYLVGVRRVTNIINGPEELEGAIASFASLEIADIKSNSWGYCILKSRNMHNAKCSVDRIPQRQNADPSLCIGCSNNLIDSGHVSGLLMSVENDVNFLQNKEVPAIFKTVQISTVTNVVKRLVQLDRNNGADNNAVYIAHLNKIIENARAA